MPERTTKRAGAEQRLRARAEEIGWPRSPDDLRRILNSLGYEKDWYAMKPEVVAHVFPDLAQAHA